MALKQAQVFIYFIHSPALPGVYLNPCMDMSPALIQINTVAIFTQIVKVYSCGYFPVYGVWLVIICHLLNHLP